MLFIYYPKCTTCLKARKWLIDHQFSFEQRDISLQNPTIEELRLWQQLSGLDLKKFFNTSGLLYKQLNLKEKLPTMSIDEQFALLATNGMLVKRPILINNNQVLVGFKENDYQNLI